MATGNLSHGSSLSRVEPLTSENYYSWRTKVLAILRSRQVYSDVIDNEPPGTDATNRSVWEARNYAALEVILCTLSEDMTVLFMDEIIAKNVWDELALLYAGDKEERQIRVRMELTNVKMTANESPADYLNRCKALQKRSQTLGQSLSDRELCYYVANGLPPKFEDIARTIRTNKNLAVNDVLLILQEECKLIETNKLEDTTEEKALKAQSTSQKRGNCFACGKFGHFARECRTNPRSSFERDRPNFWSNRGRRGRGRFARANTAENEDDEESSAHAYSLEMSDIPNDCWNLDSGCTQHITYRRDWLINVRTNHKTIHVAEQGRDIETDIMGDINLQTEVQAYGKKITRKIEIHDVIYAPNVRSNLLSVHRLTENGNRVIFYDNCAIIYSKKGIKIGFAPKKDRTYIIHTPMRQTNEICDVMRDFQTDQTLWHRRLGHVHHDYLKKLKREKMVDGLSFRDVETDQCDACVKGKLSQAPFKRIDEIQSKEILDLLHTDLCYIPVASNGGSKYILTVVDDHSRKIFVRFLSSKDETLQEFRNLKNLLETQTGCKVKRIRSDNGSEFVNKKFQNECIQNGIQHERTTTYAPESNGVAERANRTLIETAKTLLIDSQLPLCFWAEAVATAAYLRGFCPSKKSLTPNEIWSEKIPNVKKLRIFGSRVLYFIPKRNRGKLDDNAKEGIMIGYALNSAAYRIYDPSDQSIHICRTVRFFENQRTSMRDVENKMSEFQYFPDEEVIFVDEPFFETQPLIQTEKPRGRPKGSTKEVMAAKKAAAAKEREAKLLAEGVRRSERATEKAEKKNDVPETVAFTQVISPTTYEEAITSPNANEWRNAMINEMESMKKHNVWELVNYPVGKKILNSKWVFKVKVKKDGTPDKYKARLVAVGAAQRPGIDFDESYAPVLKFETFRILMALAIHENWTIQYFDVTTAYLHGDLKEEIFMKTPKGYEIPGMACHLKKSLYGLVQAGKCWNDKINEVLAKNGFTHSNMDPCLHIFNSPHGTIYLGLYVDDLVLITSNKSLSNEIMKTVSTSIDLVEVQNHQFLGMDIGKNDADLTITQASYISKILNKYGMENCKSIATPGIPLKREIFNPELREPVDAKRYQEMLGSLAYLAIATRPDISASVTILSQWSTAPARVHLIALKHVYRYLQGTRNYGLCFRKSPMILNIYTDASWDSTQDSKSISGYVVQLGDSTISWKAKKQSNVATSSCESELNSIFEGVREMKWIKQVLEDLKITLDEVKIFSDSSAAIDFLKNKKVSSRTKHLNRSLFFLRDELADTNLKITYLSSKDMPADMLTKFVDKGTLQRHRLTLGVIQVPLND